MMQRTLLLFLTLVSLPALAIGVGDNAALLTQQSLPAGSESSSSSTPMQWRNNRYGEIPSVSSYIPSAEPFGASLFKGGFSGTRSDGLNPDYRLLPGDRVIVRLWGMVEMERELSVDAQGNVFIPGIGPVSVQGVSQAQLNGKITSAVRAIYPQGVEVYTQLQGVQPVGVFVTGYVNQPGHYAGTPTDSILYFLSQAGGIDTANGSFREIRVLRNNQIVASADLYAFIREGLLPRVQFKEGDTLLVTARKASVTLSAVDGSVSAYELDGTQAKANELLAAIRVDSAASHARLDGIREGVPYTTYLPLNDFAEMSLKDGDVIALFADTQADTIRVQVEGSYYGPSQFVVPKNTRLNELLKSIAVPVERTDTANVSLRRVAVADQQRASLQDSLARLEATYLGAPSATREEAEIRVKEAELISGFVARAAQVEPSGRLVVATGGEIADVRLQDGDVITLPEISDAIMISGEVLVPQSVVFTKGRSVDDYIAGAGGYSQHADEDKILVVRLNGEVVNAKGVSLRPGDEILVLPEVPTKNLQLATSLSQILYQIAIAAKVALDL